MPNSLLTLSLKLVCLLLACSFVNISHAQDSDADGVPDVTDNCSQVSNASQVDTDADLLGNACDADFNNDGVINFLDLSQLSTAFLTATPLFDLNSDGIVNFIDVSIFAALFNSTPGPGAIGAGYAGVVQPILMTKCMPCHTGLGFGGHNVGNVYADALNPSINAACGGGTVGDCTIVRIQDGSMPPGAGCTGNPITDAGNSSCLSYDEQTLVFSWINGGLAP